MKKARDLWVIGLILLVVVVGAWLYFREVPGGSGGPLPPLRGTTNDQSLSDGTITFTYSDEEWALAVSQEQILVDSTIPPCSEDFRYCFYALPGSYASTNFNSAGLRVVEREDLTSEQACLSTLPEGYSNMTASIASTTTYARAMFAPLGDAGAGHYSSGALYRLSYGNSCYEFETRIGLAQFANFPEGTIARFTDADMQALEGRLEGLLKRLTLPGGAKPFGNI